MKISHGNFNTKHQITEDWPRAEQLFLQMADYELDLKHWKLLEATRAAMEVALRSSSFPPKDDGNLIP